MVVLVEHMNDNDLRNISADDYRCLISEAYPSPKKDIHAAVMAQVAAETEQSDKKAKILTPRRINRFVKFGSMAACFVLLVTLGFRVVPMMTKDAVMESTVETAEMQDTAAFGYAYTADDVETAASAAEDGTAPAFFAAKLTGGTQAAPEAAAEEPEAAPDMSPSEQIAEEPAAVTSYSAALADTLPEEEVVYDSSEEMIEEEMDDAADSLAIEEAPAAEEAPAEPILMMSAAPKAEKVVEEPTEELVVEEAVEELVVEEAVEECVVEEEIEECEECVVEEAIVEETPAAELAAPDYYRYGNAPDEAEAVRRTFEYELKLDLSGEAGEPAYTDWMTAHGYADVSDWSLAELVYDFGISRERFTELHTALTGTFGQLYPGYAVAEYDLDILYGMGTDITDSIARGDKGYITDALYRK